MKKQFLVLVALLLLASFSYAYGDSLFKAFIAEQNGSVSKDGLIPPLGSKVQIDGGKTGIVTGYQASGDPVVR